MVGYCSYKSLKIRQFPVPRWFAEESLPTTKFYMGLWSGARVRAVVFEIPGFKFSIKINHLKIDPVSYYFHLCALFFNELEKK
jgi:hypothetical protein